MHQIQSLVTFIILTLATQVFAQEQASTSQPNHERVMRYHPDGEDFVIKNGARRFNRALYGANTGFRVEAGDLPEFALYLPGMGGNLRLGLITKDSSKWLVNAKNVKARYRAGSMLYEVTDPLLGNGILHLSVYASSEPDGLLFKVALNNTEKPVDLLISFGGATGKRFSRDGDIGADPESSFYLKSEYCTDNRYILNKNNFTLFYGSGKIISDGKQKMLAGVFPPGTSVKISDASKQNSPQAFYASDSSATPALVGVRPLKPNDEYYFIVYTADSTSIRPGYNELPSMLQRAEENRKQLANRIALVTPDPYLNTLGPALGIAADAIWEHPSYLHGAVAWRMRLNAWRGAYVADPLGWHERAKTHFSSYAESQITSPDTGPLAPDTSLHFARHTEKIGTAMFSSGYICRNPGGDFRAHHYDMNLVFIDQLLNHFNWTGDLNYVREMWPVIKRHLKWEKRNFDHDDDGLYDAYCCIWASDALQYSNGGVTHSSSYNYKANAAVAQLAKLIGEDPLPYLKEAAKIHNAMQKNLWMSRKGWFAEYKDFMGNKSLHPSAGLWTIYHAIDSDVPDSFQKYQSLRYVDTQIPHIPIQAKGFPDGEYYTLSTTNWQPYTWSINNVALAEVLHTSLAYWQGGRYEEGFNLWKGALLESMYLSASPGGFEQLSFYDAIRGELYRDFADPIGMAGRSLVEGLFGVRPQALKDTLTIRPGFPASWNYALLSIPDVKFNFKRTENRDEYEITPSFPTEMNLAFQVVARNDNVISLTVNGQPVSWRILPNSIGLPVLEITPKKAATYIISIEWSPTALPQPSYNYIQVSDENIMLDFGQAQPILIYDPQHVLDGIKLKSNSLTAKINNSVGHNTFFVKTRHKNMEWWAPIDFVVKQHIELVASHDQDENSLRFTMRNNGENLKGSLAINPKSRKSDRSFILSAGELKEIIVPANEAVPGSNIVRVKLSDRKVIEQQLVNWNITTIIGSQEQINLSPWFNDVVTNIFKNKYLSPRPASPTLQLPWQGVGNWCYPLVEPVIDDTGLRKIASVKNSITIPPGISFSTPSKQPRNVIFTSQWDNYPDSVTIPVSGKASHVYLLMACSTNPMQSHFVNGVVTIRYTDKTESILELKNPETWWPIEQDYYTDGYAFRIDAPHPIRIHLKTGLITRDFRDYTSIKGFSNFAIEGGAATVLDLPLDPGKELKSITVKATSNDVVIGLMSATLIRER
jgi:hypothetical protein